MLNVRDYIIFALAAALAIAGLATWQYRRMFLATDFALTTQNKAIKAQNEEASRKFKTLTEKADAEQLRYRTAMMQQKEKDDAFETELDRLRKLVGSPDAAPQRVRIVSSSAWCSSGSAASSVRTGIDAGAQPDAASSGLLPAKNSRLLNERLIEVEELSRDFNKCQAELLARESR